MALRSPKSPNSDMMREYVILRRILDTDPSFHQHHISEDGKRSSSFVGVSNSRDLQEKHNFSLSKDKGQGYHRMMTKYHTFRPNVIFPLLCHHFKKDITFFDIELNTTTVYAYHCQARKSITYKFLDIYCPCFDSLIFIKDEDNYHLCHQQPASPLVSSYDMLRVYHRKCSTIESHFGFIKTTLYPSLKAHPWKTYKRKKSVIECYLSFMKDVNHGSFTAHQEQQSEDKLQLIPFLNALENKWGTMLDRQIIDTEIRKHAQQLEDMEILVQYLSSDEVKDDFILLSALICLKYKLSVVVWHREEDPRRKVTHKTFYFKWQRWKHGHVIMREAPGLHFFDDDHYIIYLRLTAKQKGYFSVPDFHHVRQAENQHKKLCNTVSFPDDPFLHDIVEKCRDDLSMDIHHRPEEAASKIHSAAEGSKPFILPFKCDNTRHTIWSTLVIFPEKANGKKLACIPYQGPDESLVKASFQKIMEFIRDHQSVPGAALLDELVDIKYLQVARVDELGAAGFDMLLEIYTAKHCTNRQHFEETLGRLYSFSEITITTQKWAVEFLTTGQHHHPWFHYALADDHEAESKKRTHSEGPNTSSCGPRKKWMQI